MIGRTWRALLKSTDPADDRSACGGMCPLVDHVTMLHPRLWSLIRGADRVRSQPGPPAPESTVDEEADEGAAIAQQSLSPILRRGAMISAGALVFTQLVTLVQTMALAPDPVPL